MEYPPYFKVAVRVYLLFVCGALLHLLSLMNMLVFQVVFNRPKIISAVV